MNFGSWNTDNDLIQDDSDQHPATSVELHHSSKSKSTNTEDLKCVTRVIIYPGCFNPPHVGHLNLLRYVIVNAECLNIVHAIILLLDDELCNTKNPSRPFTFAERQELWERDPEFPKWAEVVSLDGLDDHLANKLSHI